MTSVPQAESASERSGRRLNPSISDTDWLLLRRMRAAIDAMAKDHMRPGSTALDLGCGSRPYAPIFTARGVRYIGADLDGSPDVRISSEGQVEGADASVDAILSFQVLEHVRDVAAYLAEARRLLRPGGGMMLSTHGTWLYHPHPEDYRRWTRFGLEAELEANGFRAIQTIPLVGPLAWMTLLRSTSYAFVLRKAPLIGPLLTAGIVVLMNVRAVLEDKVTPSDIAADNACVYLVWSVPK